jgi:Zn-dependent protease
LELSPIALLLALYQFVILVFSLSVHECAHAWMAARLGDQTGRLEGRISLNPARHIDLVGTIVYPLFMIVAPLLGWGGSGVLFGWGKPVPVLTRNLQKITRDDNLITVAGPIANLLLAVAGFLFLVLLILAVPGGRDAAASSQAPALLDSFTAIQALTLLASLTIQINLALVIFNLIPIPPLDASRFVRNLLPYNALDTFDAIGRFGFVVIFILGRLLVNLLLAPATALVAAALSLFLPHR